jgi:hypothetical protein
MALHSALAVYRLAFGQARQDDVVAHLLLRLGKEEAAQLATELTIDLSPPSLKSSPGAAHAVSG